MLDVALNEYYKGCQPSRISRDVPYLGLIVPRPGLGLPGTPNVPFFGRGQMVLKWCSKRMQDRNVLASKLKLGQLILMKIIKIVATRGHILKLKCIKFDFGWGSAPEPAGELTALPQTP